MSDLSELGETGGTRMPLSDDAIAGIHSHPHGGNISPADIATVLASGKPEVVVNPSSGKAHVLTPEKAAQVWRELSKIYNEQTGETIPNYRDVSSDKNGITTKVDKVRADYVSKKQKEIKEKHDKRLEELNNRTYNSQEELNRAQENWSKEQAGYQKAINECNNLGSIPLTSENQLNNLSQLK